MSKKTVLPQEVWDALLKHPEFASQPPAMQKALRPFVEATPTVLADLLDQIVTVETLMKAKIAFLRYAVGNGFIEASVKATPKAQRDLFDGMVDMLKSALETAIDMLEEIAKDVPGFLKENEITERDLLVNPKVGLSGKALSLFDKGKLTIGELLRLQPSIIVKNT